MRRQLLATTVAVLSSGLWAQSQDTADTPALEEILVTAQKRTESLQDTPISLTAFSSERLDIDGISNLYDISAKVPSVTIEPWPINAATLIVYIRGVGIEDVQVTQDPSVGIYVDGVYLARASGNAMDLADLERIEVLRGPQGTLYGRNTTGGAINLITKRPSVDAFEFREKLTAGNRGQLVSKTSANIPLTDSLAVKLAYMRSTMDGFIENTGPGGDFGDRQVEAWRVDLHWNITDRLNLEYTYEYSDTDYYNYMYQGIKPPLSNKGSLDLFKTTAFEQSKVQRRRFKEMATAKPFEESTAEIEGHALILTQELGTTELKYIGAYRDLYDAAYADFGGGLGSHEYRLDTHEYDGPAADEANGGPTPLVIPTITQEQWSHEFQWTGDLGERVQFVAGLYYFEETATEDSSPLHHLASLPAPADVLPLFGPLVLGGTVSKVKVVDLVAQKMDIKNEAWAFYTQFTWTPPIFGDRLQLTLGGRHSDDKRSALKYQEDRILAEIYTAEGGVTAVDTSDPAFLALTPALQSAGFALITDKSFDNIDAYKEFDDDSFSFVAEYRLSDDVNIYGKVVEAYKSGGFNTRDPQRGRTGDPETDDSGEPAADGFVYGFGFVDGFDSEKVRAYELGMKGEFLDRRLRINADVFLTEFFDRQMNFIVIGTIADSKTQNAGEAETRGFEADVTWLVNRDLQLMLSYGYLEAEMKKVIDVFGNDQTDRFVFFSAPEHSYTAVVDYTILKADWGQLAFNVSYNFMDDRNGSSLKKNAANTQHWAYNLLNARLILSDVPVGNRGRLNVGLWGKNLWDEEYAVASTDSLPHADQVVNWGESRTYGIDMIFEY